MLPDLSDRVIEPIPLLYWFIENYIYMPRNAL